MILAAILITLWISPLIAIHLIGEYDVFLFRKIVGPMSHSDFAIFLQGAERQTAMRFGGAIYLWHVKYKRLYRTGPTHDAKESNAKAQGAPASGAPLPRLDGCGPLSGEKK